MLIKDLKFIEQIDDFDRVEGGKKKTATAASVINVPGGVNGSANAKAKGDKVYAKTYTNVKAYPKANGGAAAAAASGVDLKDKKISASIAADIGSLLHDLM